MVVVEGVDVELAPGPNWAVAVMIGAVQAERVASPSILVRKAAHCVLTLVGMSGFALAPAVGAEPWIK